MKPHPGWLFALLAVAAAANPRLDLGLPGEPPAGAWKEQVFVGKTDYRVVELDGRKALQATAEASASGLIHEGRIDLQATPWLNWWWRVERVADNGRELSKAGDDFVARVYAVVDGGLLVWRTRALTYVWASRQPAGSHWPNPYAGTSAQMLALRSGGADAGRWVRERRRVADDFRRVFGEEIRYIDGVALMTDSDDTGGRAQAWYGEIWFSAD